MRNSKKDTRAAYTLVDLSDLDIDLQKDIIEDANAGGGEYGIRVVEEVVNGGARAPIYGYYKEGPDAERWAAAKTELGISGSEIADGDVAGAAVAVVDPRREAAIREAAAQNAEAEADRIRAGESEALRAITGDDDEVDTGRPRTRSGPSGATDGHATNIVDSTLDPNATNEAADAENQDAEGTAKTTKTKTPK